MLLLAVLVLAAPAPRPDPGTPTTLEKRRGIGFSMLKGGQNRAAAGSFRKQLHENPESVAAHIGLARALTRQGRCGEALGHLLPYVGTIPFGAEAALSAAVCSRRLGWLEDALWFDYLATELDPLHARALSNLALDLDAWGDPIGAEEVIDRLDVSKGERDPALYVRAALAVRHGDIDEFDILAEGWADAGRKSSELRVLQAVTWMDMDDPVSALALLGQNRNPAKHEGELALVSEALRRTGEPEEGLSRLDRRNLSAADSTSVAAVRCRALVDLGDLDGAATALASWGDLPDADLLSARWYLARARHDDAAMAELAQAYTTEQESPLRTLDRLIPLDRR